MNAKLLTTALITVTLGCTTHAYSQFSAITNTTVIDGVDDRARTGVTVLIDGRLIRDIFPGDSKPLPPGTRIIDGRGKFVIAGLIDSHVHNGTIEERPQNITELILTNALLGGVTSVRDMGGRTSNVQALAARAAHDTMPWPRIYMSAIIAGPGSWFEGRRGVYMAEGGEAGAAPLVRRVSQPADVAPAITAARAAGATGIKLYNNIPPTLLPLITAEARRQGLQVWGHVAVDPGKPSDIIGAGADAISHADQFIAEIMPWPPSTITRDSARAIRHRVFQNTPLDAAPLLRVLQLMKTKGTALDATLFIMTPGPDSSGHVNERAAALYTFATGMVRKANEIGVPIVAGTDALGGSSPNIHAELQLLVERAGLTPLEALRAGTINGARVLGIDDSVGTIERGKIADLVILDANPLEDIANTLTVRTVIKAGRAHPRTGPVRTPPNARAPKQD